MRFGVHTSISGRATNGITELIDSARDLHDRGLDLWMPQLADVDALTALAVIGHQVPGVAVGTAVVPTYPRHPMMLASQALTVQAATDNQLVLGIGLSHEIVIDGSFGLSYEHPARHMREYLEVLMPLLHEGQVDHQGEVFRARSFAPVRVAGASPPTVIVAALGPRMLDIAGRLADGTALWMVGPKTIADHIVPTITASAGRAGRPQPRIVAGLPVCVTADGKGAATMATQSFGFYNDLPSYRAMLDREGVDGPVDLAVIGDEEAVAGRLRALADLGVTDLSLPVFGTAEDRARTLDLLGVLAGEDA